MGEQTDLRKRLRDLQQHGGEGPLTRTAALLFCLLTACGGTAARPAAATPAIAATSEPHTPGPIATPAFTPAPEALTITGALDVHLAQAEVGRPCGPLNGGLVAVVHFTAQGRPWSVDVYLPAFDGAHDYPFKGSRVSVHTTDIGPPPILFVGTAGTVTVDAGGRGGTLDGDFDSQTSHLHATGRWSCP